MNHSVLINCLANISPELGALQNKIVKLTAKYFITSQKVLQSAHVEIIRFKCSLILHNLISAILFPGTLYIFPGLCKTSIHLSRAVIRNG